MELDLDQSAPTNDRDALFGLIALQRGVKAETLGAAIEASLAPGGKTLSQTLFDLGAIRARDLAEIDREVRSRLASSAELDPSLTVAGEPEATAADPNPPSVTLAELREIVSRLQPPLESTIFDPGATSAAPPVDLEATIAGTLPPSSAPAFEATLAEPVNPPPRPSSTPPYLDEATQAESATSAALGATDFAFFDDARTLASTEGGPSGILDATQAASGIPSFSAWPASFSAPATEKGPSRIRYRIVREHAKGGLGEVFVALDEELNREVALKEIQGRHADNTDSRNRFLIEAEVTGGLEHPGIVPVYGLGQYPDGRPYYAMRFIRGETLKDAIIAFHQGDSAPKRNPGARELELRQLLGHFLAVCQAMHYAHIRGVIHRDLKPANIMLGAFGETLVVDWGLAKALGGPAEEPGPDDIPSLRPLSGSLRSETLYGATIGTPQFMSPEQAAGRLDAMGPASDIYSLGATLFELLTGSPPVRDRNLAAVLERVKTGDFEAPRQVNPRVPRALDAITLKAMALAPGDRYATARDLARDLERWLADEPVSVYREPWTERAARWAKRHKTPVIAAAAVLAVTTVGLLIGTILIQRERARTEANYRLATNAVDDLLTRAGEIDLADVPQMEVVRRSLLDRALVYYRKFLDEKRNDPGTRFETSRAYVRLADIDEMLGRYRSAETNYQAAIKTLESLRSADPKRIDYQRDLARARHGLAILLRKSNRFQQSETEFRAALALREALVNRGPEARAAYDDTLYHLGALLAKLSNRGPEIEAAYKTAESEMKALSSADPTRPEYRQKRARYLNNIGNFVRPIDAAKAKASYGEALALQKALSEQSPGVAAYRWGMARSQSNLGVMARESKPPDLPRAKGYYTAALDNVTKLATDFPSIPDYRYERAAILYNLATLNMVPGDPKRRQPRVELADLNQADSILEPLTAEYPQRPDYRHKLAQVHTFQGNTSSLLGDGGGSVHACEEAVDVLRKLVTDFPEVPEYESDLGLALRNLAASYDHQKLLAAHQGVLMEAIDHQRKAIALSGGREKYKAYLAGDLNFLGTFLLHTGHPAEAARNVADVPGLVPGDMRARLMAAQILSQCVGAVASEGSSETGQSTPAAYLDLIYKILGEAVEKRQLRIDDLDREDFRALQGFREFQDLRKRLRAKYVVPVVG